MARTKLKLVPNPAECAGRSVADVERDIAAAKEFIAKAEAEFWSASAVIKKDGFVVTKQVTDNHGKLRRAKRITLAARVLAEASKTAKLMKKRLEELEQELAALQAPDETDEYDGF